MNLTICPFRGPGHDSSVGERMNLTVCPLHGPGSISSHGGVFQGIFPSADQSLPTRPEPAWQKMAQSPLKDTTQLVDSKEESLTMDG